MARGVTAERVGRAALRSFGWALIMLRNGRLPAGIGAIGLAAALTFLLTDSRFAVHEVIVDGVVSLPGTTVAGATGILGASVFSIDPTAAARRVAMLPSVQRAAVSASVPGTLVIHVDERRPVVIWDTDTQSLLVDESGLVIGTAPQPLVPLLHVRALAGMAEPVPGGRVDGDALRAALAINARMPDETGVDRARVVVDPTMGVIVETERWRIIFGNDEYLGRKLAVLKYLVHADAWKYADIRDPDRPVLRSS